MKELLREVNAARLRPLQASTRHARIPGWPREGNIADLLGATSQAVNHAQAVLAGVSGDIRIDGIEMLLGRVCPMRSLDISIADHLEWVNLCVPNIE